MKQIFVINARGQEEPFSAKKTFRSARRAGASSELAQSITDIIKREVYPGIKTSVIFKRIKQLLQKKSPGIALRFNIKEGMRKLGPTGFPFEKYI
ncbi:MAG: ATPase, partial [Candidatus Nealsonbacteria bacterium]